MKPLISNRLKRNVKLGMRNVDASCGWGEMLFPNTFNLIDKSLRGLP
jgi:hypothetical protein